MKYSQFGIIICTCFLSMLSFTLWSREKTSRSTDEKPILRHSILRGGLQYGLGLPLGNNSLGNLNTPYSFSHNVNVYLKIRLKQVSILAGVRTSSFGIKGSSMQQSINDTYSKPNFEITSNAKGSSADIVTPYIGLGYHFKFNKTEFEPFARIGIGVLNYTLNRVQLSSTNSAALDQEIYFNDITPKLFLNPGIGFNASQPLSKFIRLSGTLGIDFGNPGQSELQEITNQKPNSPIRQRNVYLQQSAHNLYLMIGFEITPFNRIYSTERRYNKLKNREAKYSR